MLSNLGNALQARFERTGQLADLDEAITLFRDAVAATPVGHPERPGRLSNLGAALRTRFGRTGQLADLDQAITARQEAVAAIPADHPDRPVILSEPRGLAAGPVRAHRAAGGPGPGHHPSPGSRSRHPGRPPRPAWPLVQPRGRAADPVRAHRAADGPGAGLEVFREGAGVLTASPGLRVAAARGWGQCALLAGNPESAVEGYTAAIELLPLVAWHGLDQATREHHLREWAGLASTRQRRRSPQATQPGRWSCWRRAGHVVDSGLAPAPGPGRAAGPGSRSGRGAGGIPRRPEQAFRQPDP